MLSLISGRSHKVYTGVALLNLETGKLISNYCATQVLIKHLSEKEKWNYISKVNPLDKAGAYAVQMRPGIVKSIRGSRSNVVGLPLGLLKKMLKKI